MFYGNSPFRTETFSSTSFFRVGPTRKKAAPRDGTNMETMMISQTTFSCEAKTKAGEKWPFFVFSWPINSLKAEYIVEGDDSYGCFISSVLSVPPDEAMKDEGGIKSWSLRYNNSQYVRVCWRKGNVRHYVPWMGLCTLLGALKETLTFMCDGESGPGTRGGQISSLLQSSLLP